MDAQCALLVHEHSRYEPPDAVTARVGRKLGNPVERYDTTVYEIMQVLSVPRHIELCGVRGRYYILLRLAEVKEALYV